MRPRGPGGGQRAALRSHPVVEVTVALLRPSGGIVTRRSGAACAGAEHGACWGLWERKGRGSSSWLIAFPASERTRAPWTIS